MGGAVRPGAEALGCLLSSCAFSPSREALPGLQPLHPCVASFCHVAFHLCLCCWQLLPPMHLVFLNFINQILCFEVPSLALDCDLHGLSWH